MKVLLDECVPLQVRNALAGHEVTTAQKMGWSGKSKGDLLDVAEKSGFEIFVVADKNLRYQQKLSGRKIAILELWTNHRPTLEKSFSHIQKAVEKMKPGDYSVLDAP